jgi:serine/threonine-protein kinase RsbW
MGKKYSAVIKNCLADLARLCCSAHEFMEQSGVTAAAIYKIDLSLEELITNTIKYGYDDSLEHKIAISLDIDAGQLHLTIEDDSHEFDPTMVDEPDLNDDVSSRKIGGVGLHLIRNMVERIAYTRNGTINTVSITVLN